ncbi:MAG: enoyl-CoA hydratase/isomerase family protein [Marinibacterium sp.]|nr:enoyl-CoA hydratase/isomerase family protein [Marinibacterium sp.]
MTVQITHHDTICLITLDRPDRMNAVNAALRRDLIAALSDANSDPGIGAIVLTGAGDRAFSAGQDLQETRAMAQADIPGWLDHQRAMYQAVRDLDKACVVAINGVAAGAGFQIALCADLRVTHGAARLGQPEIRAGLASIVGTYLMSLHLPLAANTQLSLTGELIDGHSAHRLGLINHLVDRDQVLGTAMDQARKLAALPPTAMRVSKARLRDMTQPGFDAACDAAVALQLACYASGEPQAAQEAFLARAR